MHNIDLSIHESSLVFCTLSAVNLSLGTLFAFVHGCGFNTFFVFFFTLSHKQEVDDFPLLASMKHLPYDREPKKNVLKSAHFACSET